MNRDDSSDNPSRELSESGRRSLEWWFQLETWEPKEAICLICGIDPRMTKIAWDDITIEKLRHNGIIKKGDYETFLYEGWEPCLSAWSEASKDDEEAYLDAMSAVAEYQMEFEDSLKDVWMRFSRAVDFEADGFWGSRPKNYLNWAKSKGIEIPWFDWAERNGYLNQELIGNHSDAEQSPEAQVKKSPNAKTSERQKERGQEIEELRNRAKKVAVKLKNEGIHLRYITTKRICQELLNENFSSGKPFASRWGTIEGMRSILKNEHNPKKTVEYRNAKTQRSKFNN